MKKVCVVGLGYIGLPTASMFATHGFLVHGVDVNPLIIQTLREGKIHIEEPGLATVVKAAISSKNLHVESKPAPADVFIIAVPTPYTHQEGKDPVADMSFVQSAAESILPYLKKGNLVILESTSPPGTTRDLIVPLIQKTKLQPGSDVGVAYCPERVIPGQALRELINNDRVIGAINHFWAEETKKLYRSFVAGEIFLTEPTVAEMVKLLENTYRDVNIALSNEVAQICEKLGINVWEVIQLANRHPRVHVHKPGPGVGGHCISVDPWFIVEKYPKEAHLIRTARHINDSMPAHVVDIIERLLEGKKKAKIAVLGLSYKGNVDDLRESPSLTVLRLLKSKYPDFTLTVYDPHVESEEFPTSSIQETFQGADLAVVLTAHDEYRFLDPEEVGSLMATRLVFDAHNWLKAERWLPAGFRLFTLGKGASVPNEVTSTS
ncbi:MAG: nucleotide sugar dehydrogenase [Elusimicrobia bacterium]|nr:nucleotide sugar dehydrogenase [Candidatus Obscuribacterium magneticum]